MKLVAIVALVCGLGCMSPTPYQRTTTAWTRKARLRGGYQEALQLAAVYKSPAWYLAHAQKDIDSRGLTGAARDARIVEAQANAGGPFEIELLVTTWDRRENDLDRGDKSVWRVRMLDDSGMEIRPIELVRDKRPQLVLRAEFPAMGDFSTAYIARFPRKLEANAAEPTAIRLRISSERGGVEVEWPRR